MDKTELYRLNIEDLRTIMNIEDFLSEQNDDSIIASTINENLRKPEIQAAAAELLEGFCVPIEILNSEESQNLFQQPSAPSPMATEQQWINNLILKDLSSYYYQFNEYPLID